MNLHHGDCLHVLKGLPDNSVDSIVTDPPYGLKFLNRHWDYDVPSVDVWRECLRVLKPGGHLLAFAGTRTQHRMAVRIEDAGFEVRDQIMWIYGCLDEQTEVATAGGVKPYHKTKVGDLVLCYDAEQGQYSYQPILEIVEYDYRDTAYRLVGDFGEQVVSRNHRCIVERNGVEVFERAETLQREACVPFLEDLPALQRALSRADQGTGVTEQNVQQGLRESDDRGGKFGADAAGTAQGQNGTLRSLQDASVETGRMVAEDRATDVQLALQREVARGRVGETCAQGAGRLDGCEPDVVHAENVGRSQSRLEGRRDISHPQGALRESVDQVRAVPGAPAGDGAKGRVCDGASLAGGAGNGAHVDASGVRASHQPQCDGQPAAKPDAVRNERRAQGIRAWGGHKTAMVRVVPFHYTGKVWCLRVPTGAFVAVRNGVAFPTGNSGFPKSLDVSKAIDKVNGEVGRLHKFTAWMRTTGLTARQINDSTGTRMASHYLTDKSQPAIPTRELWEKLRPLCGDVPAWVDELVERIEAEREVLAQGTAKLAQGRLNAETAGSGGFGYGAEYNITAPATEAARQWQGWGTALKPALETVTFASKPYTDEQVRDIIQSNLFRLEARLWLLSSANAAGKSSTSNQSEYGAACAIAQWSADEITSTLAALCDPMGMSLFELATTTSLNIVSSWRRTLAESWSDGSTSTTETKSSTTTDWRTLKFSLSQITPSTIIRACSLPGGFSVNASTAESYFNASLLLLQSILTLSVTEPVISLAQHEHQGAGVTPNLDPVVLARKPLIGTVAANVLAHGTGALNIDASRIMTADQERDAGRWPANLIHDGDAAADLLGDAARFFYCAKASKRDRGEGNTHPTVKPTELMRYLCRLVTPPGGTVLDPFMGSGSTGKAAVLEGFRFIGIEREAEYLEIARARIRGAA